MKDVKDEVVEAAMEFVEEVNPSAESFFRARLRLEKALDAYDARPRLGSEHVSGDRPTLDEVLAQTKDWTLLDALSHVATWENERAVAQALRGERDPHTGALWDTCFRYAFEAVLASREPGEAGEPAAVPKASAHEPTLDRGSGEATNVVSVRDMSGDGSGPWRLMINGYGCADWPVSRDINAEAQHYSKEVARCVRLALDRHELRSEAAQPTPSGPTHGEVERWMRRAIHAERALEQRTAEAAQPATPCTCGTQEDSEINPRCPRHGWVSAPKTDAPALDLVVNPVDVNRAMRFLARFDGVTKEDRADLGMLFTVARDEGVRGWELGPNADRAGLWACKRCTFCPRHIEELQPGRDATTELCLDRSKEYADAVLTDLAFREASLDELLGEVMKRSKGRVNPQLVREYILATQRAATPNACPTKHAIATECTKCHHIYAVRADLLSSFAPYVCDDCRVDAASSSSCADPRMVHVLEPEWDAIVAVVEAARTWLFACDQPSCERKASCSDDDGSWSCEGHRGAHHEDLRRRPLVLALERSEAPFTKEGNAP